MSRLDFVYFDAGGGHRAAATALQAAIAAEGRPWNIRLVSLQEVLDEIDVFRKLTGTRLQDIYNLLLRKGWTLGSPQLLRLMQRVIRLFHPQQVRLIARFFAQSQPDLVVSLIPNFGRALWEGLRQACPATPLVTILTDLADYPPHLWIEPGQDQYYICGADKAVQQAYAMGYKADRVFRVSGMIVHPRFYQAPPVDRARERAALALDPDLPTALLLFGGQGSPAMQQILERLQAANLSMQAIAVCGRNEALRRQLESRRWRFPLHVEGFTHAVPYFMQLADFFIGKPGPGSISEALAMQLPVIVERNAWTLPQERYNADWILEHEVGLVLSSFRRIAEAVAHLLSNDRLARFKQNAARIRNRAVFEIPPILERLLKKSGE